MTHDTLPLHILTHTYSIPIVQRKDEKEELNRINIMLT